MLALPLLKDYNNASEEGNCLGFPNILLFQLLSLTQLDELWKKKGL